MAKTKTIEPEDAIKAFQEWDTQAQVQHLYKVMDILNDKQSKLKEQHQSTQDELTTIEKAIKQ